MLNCLLICPQLSFSTLTLFGTHLHLRKSADHNGARSFYISDLNTHTHMHTQICPQFDQLQKPHIETPSHR